MMTGDLVMARLVFAGVAVSVLGCASPGWCQGSEQGTPAAAATTETRRINEPARDRELAAMRRSKFEPSKDPEELRRMQALMKKTLDDLRTMTSEVEYSKRREDEKQRRKYYLGSLEISREVGGRVDFTRKGNREEYIANTKVIWSADYDDKVAQFIPSSTPIVGDFLAEGLRMNAFLAMDEETIEMRGSQDVEGEPCWVVTGLSPKTLSRVGLDPVKIRVWISKNDGLPRMISVPDEGDLLIILRNIKTNVEISDSRFQWSPPDGMKTKNIFGF